jgi:hypothetical protein
MESKEDTHSFIVRVWFIDEDGEDVPPLRKLILRGSIDHVGSGKRMYFYRLRPITDFILDQVGNEVKRPISIGASIKMSVEKKIKSFMMWIRHDQTG